MLAPSLGAWLYGANVFFFGEFGFYYPFALFVGNYLAFKRGYKLENFRRAELFGWGLALFAALLLFAVFYRDSGAILELIYTVFGAVLGRVGSGILGVLFLLFSIVLLFPNFIKIAFGFEPRWDFLLRFEEGLKKALMRIFGGEEAPQNPPQSLQEAPPQRPIQEPVKEAPSQPNSLAWEDLEQEISQDPPSQPLPQPALQPPQPPLPSAPQSTSKQEDAPPQSFIHERSEEVQAFVRKASKSVIALDEEFDFISPEELDVIPEKFLKPKKKQDFDALERTNLDAPSYQRKNIDIPSPRKESAPKIFSKELQERESLMHSAKLQQEYEQRQKEEALERLENEGAQTASPLAQDSKYSFEGSDCAAEFEPVVEELEFSIPPPPSVISLDALGSNFEPSELEPEQNFAPNFAPQPSPQPTTSQEVAAQDLTPQEFVPEEPSPPSPPSQGLAPQNSSEDPKAILAKEIALNQALLAEIERGDFEAPRDFELPPLEFLIHPGAQNCEIDEREIDKKIYDLLEKLRRFKIGGDVISTYTGPVVSTFEFRPSADVKVSRILNLQDDLAMALRARSIRIQAPIPGKDVVGIEVPNEQIQTIYLREILESEPFKNAKSPLTMALGKDIVGNAFITDLKKLPHLLIAGTTGSGKSVGINAMLLSLLCRNSPKTLRLLMIDPKMLEFSIYNDIPHLLTPVITDPKKAVNALSNMVAEMERRYRLMADAKTKNIENFNDKMKEQGEEELPFIVVIIDELADLMMTAGKDVEFYIARLAQMARASGIHLIVATQRPSVDVVTGLIKANLPSRLAYKVGQKIDSKVILDAQGAESLLGRGDCLFTPPGSNNLVRLHAPFASELEIERIVEFLKAQQAVVYDESFLKDEQGVSVGDAAGLEGGLDELYEEAKRVILEDNKTSISYLQRRLKIGYNRAANIIEQLAQTGFLSEPDSKGQREIL